MRRFLVVKADKAQTGCHNVGFDAQNLQGKTSATFIDLFAGAGGLSLGLMAAGLRGLFAVETEPNAFATLKANLIDGVHGHLYEWPTWLPKEPIDIGALIGRYEDNLRRLRGRVDVLAGGPPCQGFSAAGRRRRDDPRNRLFELYACVAELIQPSFLVFENVPWIAIPFGKKERKARNPRGLGRPSLPYSTVIAKRLALAGYDVVGIEEHAVDFGVPQARTRYLMVGMRKELEWSLTSEDIKGLLSAQRDDLLSRVGLKRLTTLKQAISDLETRQRALVACEDSPGFKQVRYAGPRTAYQKVMHQGMAPIQAPNSLRIANQRPETVARLRKILTTCRKDVRLSPRDRERYGINKASTTPLAPNKPSKTITSLPDDLIHYSEPRILTVRECARVQSFPDWFEFHGKYTTGGDKRRYEVPRYTQVANAVPPLLAQVIGGVLLQMQSKVAQGTILHSRADHAHEIQSHVGSHVRAQ
jgi:DNA (cytosine-5)-methyltransferase 1